MTKHNHLTTLASRIGLAVVLGLFSMAPAMAGKIYDNRDFRGEYKASLIEVELISDYEGLTQYCSAVVTVVADGDGTMEFDGTSRCNDEVMGLRTEEISGVMTYEVEPNGEIWLYEPDSEYPKFHGVIVDRGDAVLLDSSAGSDSMLFQQGSLVKQ